MHILSIYNASTSSSVSYVTKKFENMVYCSWNYEVELHVIAGTAVLAIHFLYLGIVFGYF